MPRTTLNLDAAVLDALRARGAREKKSISALASELLAQQLRRRPADHEPEKRSPLMAHDLGLPLVDLEDAEAVRIALDEG